MKTQTMIILGVLAYLYFRSQSQAGHIDLTGQFIGPPTPANPGTGLGPGTFVGPIQPASQSSPYPTISCTDVNGNVFQVAGGQYFPATCPPNSLPVPNY